MTHEPAPLSLIQQAVLEFLQDRDDVVVFGAQAVNAYVDEPRMTQDVDIIALDADELAATLCGLLGQRFNIAGQIRSVASGKGLRLYQVRTPKNRHLVDIRSARQLPPNQTIERVRVPLPSELIAQKVISMSRRSLTAKGMTHIADLRRLLLAFPELKEEEGPVNDSLRTACATETEMAAWRELVSQEIQPDDYEEY